MSRLLQGLALRTPLLGRLVRQVRRQGAYPAGHYYSPIPDEHDVSAYLVAADRHSDEVPGVDLNREGQLALLHEFTSYYNELPFAEQPDPDRRYHFENRWFSYSDAIYLYGFLRKFQPKRIVEIGSGYSTAAMLDTIERFFSCRPQITCVEPFPERLISLLRPGDAKRIDIVQIKVQEASQELFSVLCAGDLLFIDSSHVVKCGSDLQHLLFKVLPTLRPGVWVHFHDVFRGFEYPAAWLKGGRYWNEDYFLRAFLCYNSAWRIRLFGAYAASAFADVLREKMPLCLRNPGGSLYIERID